MQSTPVHGTRVAPVHVTTTRSRVNGGKFAEASVVALAKPLVVRHPPASERAGPDVGASRRNRTLSWAGGAAPRQQHMATELGVQHPRQATPHHVHHIPLSSTPELQESHTAFFAPFSSAVECHGCYRILGPATITKTGMGNHVEACLADGAILELFHPDGNVLVSRDALSQLEERYFCICIGHNLEIRGEYQLLLARPQGSADADLHMNVHDGKLVVCVDCLPLGTIIELSPGAVLMHPVTVTAPFHN